jgi:hypothetical protein
MKAEELMVGNYIYWDIPQKQNKPHRVISISEKRILTLPVSAPDSIDEYKPIPLTEEWLVRFGFENCINGWWSENELFNVKFIDNDIEIYLSGSDNDLAYKKIKYVHQIQNLYYIIIGEHLTIK